MIQIGTESGFLPTPVVVPAQPTTYNYNRRDIVVLNIDKQALYPGTRRAGRHHRRLLRLRRRRR